MLGVVRRLFNMLAAVSLVLCAASGGVWAQSLVGVREKPSGFFLEDLIGSRSLVVELYPGEVDGALFTERGPVACGYGWSHHYIDLTGFHAWRFDLGSRYGVRARVSLWWPLLVYAVLPSAAVILWKRSRSSRDGHCSTCGYDLRGTPARCPECGTAVGPVA
jgi:hypothetical protein